MTYGEDGTVINRSKQLKEAGYKVIVQLTRPLTGLVLGLGILFSGTPTLSTQAAELAIPSSSSSSTPILAARPLDRTMDIGHLYSGVVSNPTTFPANGIYLYGQSPYPEQIGAAYAVMEIIDNEAVGAFYMPQSSFDCFYGAVEPDNLNLNIVSSYDQATHEYSVAFASGPAIATTADQPTSPVQLMGYHSIDTLSSNDHRILGVCRTNLENQI